MDADVAALPGKVNCGSLAFAAICEEKWMDWEVDDRPGQPGGKVSEFFVFCFSFSLMFGCLLFYFGRDIACGALKIRALIPRTRPTMW